MNIVKVAGIAAATLPLSLLSAGPASAEPATVYRGVFTGVQYTGCTTTPPSGQTVTGPWTISTHNATDAVLTVNIAIDGKHHVSFGAPVSRVEVQGADIAVQLPTQAGTLTVSVTGNAMAYTIAPYNYNGLECTNVTYSGVRTN